RVRGTTDATGVTSPGERARRHSHHGELTEPRLVRCRPLEWAASAVSQRTSSRDSSRPGRSLGPEHRSGTNPMDSPLLMPPASETSRALCSNQGPKLPAGAHDPAVVMALEFTSVN